MFDRFSSVVRGEAAPPPTTTSSFSKVAQNKITYANMSSHGRHPPLSSEGSDVVPVNSSQISSRTSDDAPTDPRLGHRPPPDINHLSPPSQGGFSQSQTDGSSSQEYHMVDSTDTDSGNVKGGWTSQESAASLTEEGPERGGSQCGGQVDLVVAEEDEEEQTEEFEEGREKEAKDKEVKVHRSTSTNNSSCLSVVCFDQVEEQVVEIPVASAMADEVGGDQQESKEEAATPPKDGSTEEASADKEK